MSIAMVPSDLGTPGIDSPRPISDTPASVDAAALPPAETGTPWVGVAPVARTYLAHIDGLLDGLR